MLLIDDNQAERIHRRKNRRARANNNPGAALANFVPFIMAFAGRKVTMQHGYERAQGPRAEAGLETFDCLRCERDFRHEHNCSLALRQRV